MAEKKVSVMRENSPKPPPIDDSDSYSDVDDVTTPPPEQKHKRKHKSRTNKDLPAVAPQVIIRRPIYVYWPGCCECRGFDYHLFELFEGFERVKISDLNWKGLSEIGANITYTPKEGDRLCVPNPDDQTITRIFYAIDDAISKEDVGTFAVCVKNEEYKEMIKRK